MSSEKYSLDSSSQFTHLTNNAVQKHAINYGEFEEGNILPLSFLYKEGIIEKDDLYGQMKRLIGICFKSSMSKLFIPNDKHQSIAIGNSGTKSSANKSKCF
jgi:hypothetical protein